MVAKSPPPGRVLAFGYVCFVIGWALAGYLEFFKVALWKDVLVLLIMMVVIAAAYNRL